MKLHRSFCWSGKNCVKATDKILLGSPLLALTTRFPFSGYFFAEFNQDCYEALERRCSAFSRPDLIHNYQRDANQIISTIVTTIRQFSPNSLNLAFLDPEGLELNWETVAQLGTLRCDLIIHYSQQGITRNIGKAYETPNETSLDRFFGTDAWRNVYAPYYSKTRTKGLHRELIDFYKERLHSLGY